MFISSPTLSATHYVAEGDLKLWTPLPPRHKYWYFTPCPTPPQLGQRLPAASKAKLASRNPTPILDRNSLLDQRSWQLPEIQAKKIRRQKRKIQEMKETISGIADTIEADSSVKENVKSEKFL